MMDGYLPADIPYRELLETTGIGDLRWCLDLGEVQGLEKLKLLYTPGYPAAPQMWTATALAAAAVVAAYLYGRRQGPGRARR